MALFRYQRGSLEESLRGTIIVKSAGELVDVLHEWIKGAYGYDTSFVFKHEAYPNDENCFDDRIGWYTHLVSIAFKGRDDWVPVGFLSERLIK